MFVFYLDWFGLEYRGDTAFKDGRSFPGLCNQLINFRRRINAGLRAKNLMVAGLTSLYIGLHREYTQVQDISD